ncbi:MAG: hypothetical protein DDT34_00914 [Firmicutes bacterium]|nr:hypothetical protein [Bacillota bacterium]
MLYGEGGGYLFKATWVGNVRALLAENNMTVAEAARLLGTSKQYLTAILGDSEPQSTKEQVIEGLSLLLHAHPSRLYSPRPAVDESEPLGGYTGRPLPDMPTRAVEQVVLAERHFLGGDYRGSLAVLTHLLALHGDDLQPMALAQAKLLAGKSACLLGQADLAQEFLRFAQRTLQKRVAARPQKYLLLCLECYRYLAIAAHLEQDYDQAMKMHRRAIFLAVKYRACQEDMDIKWETLGHNMLRTATKQGSLAKLVAAAHEVEFLAAQVSNSALAERAELTREFARFAVARAEGRAGAEIYLPMPIAVRDPVVILQCGLARWAKDEDLRTFLEALSSESENEDLHLVLYWLRCLATRTVSKTLPPVTATFKPLRHLLKICLAKSEEREEALFAWQETLLELKASREIPLYFFIFVVGLDKFADDLKEHNKKVLAAVLARALASYIA